MLKSGLAVLAGFAFGGLGYAQQATPQIQVQPVQGNIYMLLGAGGNITVSVGRDGVLLVDAGLPQMTDQVLAAIRKLAHIDQPLIRYIIDTHIHADHTGGNEKIAKAGKTVTGGNVAGDINDAAEGAAIIAQQSVLDRMSAPSGKEPAAPTDAWPTDTYHSAKNLSQFFNGEAVQIFHPPAAHTDGDSIVYFRHSDVIATGDIFVTNSYPIIDLQRGGSINGIVAALNRVLELAVPEFRLEGGTLIVPGHGRLCDSADVAYYRDMVTIIRDRIQDMVRKGMTLEQVKAAKPTMDYDGIYGADKGFWTTDMFVEAAYKSLSAKK
jgi:cyclase